MSPLVVVTSLKAGESSPSTSEMERLPVAVVVPESSVTEPVASDHRSIISASDGDGDGLFCVVSGCEGVSVMMVSPASRALTVALELLSV